MKKLIILLLLFVGLKSFSQAPVNVSQAQYFLKYIWVKDSVRATIYFQGTNDTLATQAYVRAHMGSGASGIAGFGIKISNDSFSVDTTKLIKQDSMWVVNDTTFIIKINSRLTTFHMRGAVVSYNGRVGAIVSNPADYSAFYVSLTGTYNNPVWLNSFAWTKLSGVPSTLVGYGIIDGVTNLGGSQTWASGTFAARPAAGNINGAFYMAKDTNAIYFDNGASWQKVAGGTGSGSDSGIVATNGILKTVSSTTITLKSDTSLLATRYDIARDSIYNGATFYPLTNPSAYINLTSISALPPMLYNNSIGVISADTSAGLTHLATQAYVKSLTDTNGVHPIGTGSPMIQTLFAGTGGDLRTSRWGPGLFTIPRLASDSLAFIDLDTSAIGYKSWIIAQYGPGTGSQKPTLDSVLAYGDTAYQKQMIISWDAFGGPVTHPFFHVNPDSLSGFFSVGDVNGNRTNLFLNFSQRIVGFEADSGLYIKAGGNTQFTDIQTQAAQNSTVKRLKLPNTGNLVDTVATLWDVTHAVVSFPPNVGSGYRIYAPQTPGIKSLACTGCTLDSVTTGQLGITVTDATISTTNITTNNVSTSKHGWAPILPNDSTKFLNGLGAYTTPTVTSYQTLTASGSTSFTFTLVPASFNDYLIFVNGVLIIPTTDYTTSGNVVTIPGIITGDKVVFRRIK